MDSSFKVETAKAELERQAHLLSKKASRYVSRYKVDGTLKARRLARAFLKQASDVLAMTSF